LPSLSDIDVDRLGQSGAGDSDEMFITMTPHVAVAAAKKILIQRNHKGRISFKQLIT